MATPLASQSADRVRACWRAGSRARLRRGRVAATAGGLAGPPLAAPHRAVWRWARGPAFGGAASRRPRGGSRGRLWRRRIVRCGGGLAGPPLAGPRRGDRGGARGAAFGGAASCGVAVGSRGRLWRGRVAATAGGLAGPPLAAPHRAVWRWARGPAFGGAASRGTGTGSRLRRMRPSSPVRTRGSREPEQFVRIRPEHPCRPLASFATDSDKLLGLRTSQAASAGRGPPRRVRWPTTAAPRSGRWSPGLPPCERRSARRIRTNCSGSVRPRTSSQGALSGGNVRRWPSFSALARR